MIYHNFVQITGTASLAQMPSYLAGVTSDVQTQLNSKISITNGVYSDLNHTLADTVTYAGLDLTGKTGHLQIVTDTGLIGEFYIGNGALLAAPPPIASDLVNITATSAGAIALNLNVYLATGVLTLDNRTGGSIIAHIRGLGQF